MAASACAGTPTGSSSPPPASAASPQASSGSSVVCDSFGPCFGAAGHYDLDEFQPAISFDLGEGWTVNGPPSKSLLAWVRGPDEFLEIARNINRGLDDTEALVTIEQTPAAFVDWLRSRTALDVGATSPTTLGGLDAIQVDVSVREPVSLYTYASDPATYRAAAGQTIRFILAERDGELLSLAAESPAAAFDQFWTDSVQPVVASLTFP
ncbi:MAG TPA: hypothetical protein VIF84_07100 [Candidatus Limnocylindrales bacterium]